MSIPNRLVQLIGGMMYARRSIPPRQSCNVARTHSADPLSATKQVTALTRNIAAKIKATQGFVALAVWSQTDLSDATVRNIPVNGIDEFEDSRVNNALDWRRESIAVYPIERNRTRRHLLVIRPEAIDAFLTCLRESPRAREIFEGRRPRNRVLGYVRVGEELSIRTLIVVETLLPMPLPTDEEDLLGPLPG